MPDVKDMMQSDVKLMQKDQYLKEGGYYITNNPEQFMFKIKL